MSQSKKSGPPKRRNPMHNHPLLKKSGPHQKSRKAERRSEKIKTEKLEDD